MQLVALTPGIALTPTYQNGNADPSGDIGGVGFSANGGRNVASVILLDGSPQEVMGYNQRPPTYTSARRRGGIQGHHQQPHSRPKYGRTGGAVISIVHRSGTKAFHGVLYEFLRNNVFDANDFFSNRSGKARAPVSLQSIWSRPSAVRADASPASPLSSSSAIRARARSVRARLCTPFPTAAMLQGDFSGAGSQYLRSCQHRLHWHTSAVPRQSSIPQSRFNWPVAQKMLSYYAAPNQPGLSSNFFSRSR